MKVSSLSIVETIKCMQTANSEFLSSIASQSISKSIDVSISVTCLIVSEHRIIIENNSMFQNVWSNTATPGLWSPVGDRKY
jgi:hypothetical protein